MFSSLAGLALFTFLPRFGAPLVHGGRVSQARRVFWGAYGSSLSPFFFEELSSQSSGVTTLSLTEFDQPFRESQQPPFFFSAFRPSFSLTLIMLTTTIFFPTQARRVTAFSFLTGSNFLPPSYVSRWHRFFFLHQPSPLIFGARVLFPLLRVQPVHQA